MTRIPRPALRSRNRRCSRGVAVGGDEYPRWCYRGECRREQRHSDKDGQNEGKSLELPCCYLHCTPGCRVGSPGLKKSTVIVPQIELKRHWTDKCPIAEGCGLGKWEVNFPLFLKSESGTIVRSIALSPTILPRCPPPFQERK